jgi:D-erythrulose 4-kinase
MTHLFNDPAEFKNDVLKGFAAAYPQYAQRVLGASGFVRAGGPLEGKVSLVIGGGSGHFPSYNGVVGDRIRRWCRARRRVCLTIRGAGLSGGQGG